MSELRAALAIDREREDPAAMLANLTQLGGAYAGLGEPQAALAAFEEERGWISARWGTSDSNRKARFYALTAAGRTQLVVETSKWQRLTRAIALVLGPEAPER